MTGGTRSVSPGFSADLARAPSGAGQSGLSLIELMLALALGAFLVLAVVSVFLANKDAARRENSLARLQETGRFALDRIRADIHRAQYLGCNTGEVFLVDMIDNPNAAGFGPALNGLRGYEREGNGAWRAAPPVTDLPPAVRGAQSARGGGGARHGSDVLSVRMAKRLQAREPGKALLTAAVLPSSTSVSINDNPDCAIKQGSRVVLTGCALTAHRFRVSNAPACSARRRSNPATLEFAAPANATNRIDIPYDTSAELLLFEEAVWFVSDTGRDRQGQDVWALFRQVNEGRPQEMIEGVEHMQIRFGQRVRASDSIRYVDPSDAELNALDNYEGAISVRIALLVQSFERVRNDDDERTYVLIDEPVPGSAGAAPAGSQGALHASGPVQRGVFSSTVTLRNAPAF